MTLSPADHARLRNTRGEHMEGVEVVTITRADLDALIAEAHKVACIEALAEAYELTAGMIRYGVDDKQTLEAVARDIRATIGDSA